jgi:hypothetical protein
MYNSAVVTFGNLMFVIGGWINSPTADVFVYDDRTDRWTKGVKMSATRYSGCAVIFEKTIVVSGGTTTLPTGGTADLVLMISSFNYESERKVVVVFTENLKSF